jgi:hypothetical protein
VLTVHVPAWTEKTSLPAPHSLYIAADLGNKKISVRSANWPSEEHELIRNRIRCIPSVNTFDNTGTYTRPQTSYNILFFGYFLLYTDNVPLEMVDSAVLL